MLDKDKCYDIFQKTVEGVVELKVDMELIKKEVADAAEIFPDKK